MWPIRQGYCNGRGWYLVTGRKEDAETKGWGGEALLNSKHKVLMGEQILETGACGQVSSTGYLNT